MAASSSSVDGERYPSTPTGTIPAMPSGGKSGGRDRAARALRALERGAATLSVQVSRSVDDWRRRQAASRAPRPAHEPIAGAAPRPATVAADVSDVEVRDLRAELARELGRLAGAEISASRGTGRLAGETPSADGRA
jgi:hypothetical protein